MLAFLIATWFSCVWSKESKEEILGGLGKRLDERPIVTASALIFFGEILPVIAKSFY